MEPSQRQPISRRRIVGVIITVILACLALDAFLDAKKYGDEFQAGRVAEPARFSVDLSVPGTTEGRLVHASSLAGRLFTLEWTSLPEGSLNPVAGLAGSIELLGNQGQPYVRAIDALGTRHEANELTLAHVGPFTKGEYTVRVNVDEPAKELAGVRQTLVCRYEITPTQSFPGLMCGMAAAAYGLPALIIGGFTTYGLCRYGWRKKPRL